MRVQTSRVPLHSSARLSLISFEKLAPSTIKVLPPSLSGTSSDSLVMMKRSFSLFCQRSIPRGPSQLLWKKKRHSLFLLLRSGRFAVDAIDNLVAKNIHHTHGRVQLSFSKQRTQKMHHSFRLSELHCNKQEIHLKKKKTTICCRLCTVYRERCGHGYLQIQVACQTYRRGSFSAMTFWRPKQSQFAVRPGVYSRFQLFFPR